LHQNGASFQGLGTAHSKGLAGLIQRARVSLPAAGGVVPLQKKKAAEWLPLGARIYPERTVTGSIAIVKEKQKGPARKIAGPF
jgi:hypothetical protein